MENNQQTKIQINYKPHPKQKSFHQERLNYLWRAIIAGTGSGKTHAGAAEHIYHAIKNKGSVNAIYEPTFPMINRILIPKFNQLLGSPFENNPIVKSYNKADGLITWITESQTWLNSLQEPERAEGQNLDSAWLDEARLVRDLKTSLQVIGRRLRGSGIGTEPKGWITTTPDNPLSDLWEFLENPQTRNPNSKIYRMTIFDNPYLPKTYVDDVIREHTGGLYQRFVLGLFADVGTGSFQYEYGIHTMGYSPPIRPTVYYGVDLGWTNPSAVIAVGFDSDRRAYAMDEVYETQLSEELLIQRCKELQFQYGNGIFFVDRTEPRTIEAMRRAGLNALPDVSKFDDGIREIGSRLQVSGDGKPRLFISPSCVNLIEEIQLYDATLPKGKQRDHATDGLRYVLANTITLGQPSSRSVRKPR